MELPEQPIDELLRSLHERAKELNCLYRIEELLKDSARRIEEVLADVVRAIPEGMQFPKITRARVVYQNVTQHTSDFSESPWVLSAGILVQGRQLGRLDIYYTEQVPDEDEGPFLKEERRLIDSIADRIGYFLERGMLERAYAAARDTEERKELLRPTWYVIIDFIRRTDQDLLLRIARKLLNQLCWNGVADASVLMQRLQMVENPAIDTEADDNQPIARRHFRDTPAIADEVFAIAGKHLPEDELLSLVQRWIKEDKTKFLIQSIGNPDSTIEEVSQALARFHHTGPEGQYLSPSTEKGLRVSLTERFFTEELNYINTAKRFVDIDDFFELSQRIVSPPRSHGKLGGKSAGLFLAMQIVRRSEEHTNDLGSIKTPRSWHVTSDGLLEFIRFNSLEDVYSQKYLEVDRIRQEYPRLVQVFKNSSFPPEMVNGLASILDDFGARPLIVRSSSLLEDRFGAAFSGKYKSLFLANCGSKRERLTALLDAIAEVYASTFAPDPIEYRAERGLLDVYEEMGILIQEVVGKTAGDYFFPSFAGVAFSNNEFRWSARIQREDGLVRLVPGMGTRAVDRLKDDYPVLLAPGQPGLRVNVSADETFKYSPKMMDVINLKKGRFETIEISELLRVCGMSYPNIQNIVSILEEDQLRRPSGLGIDFEHDELVVTFEGLATSTPFIGQIHALLGLLKKEFRTPVDIEFASDGDNLYLLQCRPQSYAGESAPAPIPRDIDEGKIVFTANRFVSNGRVPDITHIVYVDHVGYQSLPKLDDLKAVGQAVGRLNKLLPKRQFILMGPGRWGSRGDIKLGVSITYADINNTAVLIEIARRKQNYLPDLSFGTHFFQDLVEGSIRYLPLYPDDEGIQFNERFLTASASILLEILPEYAHLDDTIRVIDIPSVTGGQILRVLMNADLDESIAFLSSPQGQQEYEIPGGTIEQVEVPQAEHSRWRVRFAHKLAADLAPDRFGVKSVYLIGSAKNGTAGPGSDIDLLIHFAGTENQLKELEIWLEGWNLALAEMNYLRTGYKTRDLLDVHILTDEDFQNRTSFAIKVDAITDPAQKLSLKSDCESTNTD